MSNSTIVYPLTIHLPTLTTSHFSLALRPFFISSSVPFCFVIILLPYFAMYPFLSAFFYFYFLYWLLLLLLEIAFFRLHLIVEMFVRTPSLLFFFRVKKDQNHEQDRTEHNRAGWDVYIHQQSLCLEDGGYAGCWCIWAISVSIYHVAFCLWSPVFGSLSFILEQALLDRWGQLYVRNCQVCQLQ